MFCKNGGVLRNFTKFTGKHLCQRLLFKKTPETPETLLKKSLWHRRFPVNFAKFLRTPFLQNTSGRLLLVNDVCNFFVMVTWKTLQKQHSYSHACFCLLNKCFPTTSYLINNIQMIDAISILTSVGKITYYLLSVYWNNLKMHLKVF